MGSICFLHTDYWRLAEPIAGLTGAPGWLRRLVRDAGRTAVLKTFELASAHQVDFLFLAGAATNEPAHQDCVAAWLSGPLNALKSRGIRVVMAASGNAALDRLADVVLHPNHWLAVDCRPSLRLTPVPIGETSTCELALVPFTSGFLPAASHRYRYRVSQHHTVETDVRGHRWVSAGVTQTLHPGETQTGGCLIVRTSSTGGCDAEPVVDFHRTGVLRFERRGIRIPAAAGLAASSICDAVTEASRTLTAEGETAIVDWDVELTGGEECGVPIEAEALQETQLLEAVRSALQNGHLGTWPRRIDVRLPEDPAIPEQEDTCIRTFGGVLRDRNTTDREPLIIGLRLLRRTA